MSTRKKSLLPLIMLTLVAVVLSACQEEDPRDLADEPYERTEFLLGTVANIRVYNEGKEEAMDKAFEHIADLDRRFAMQNPDSEISEINRQAGIAPVEVSEEVFLVMETALYYAEESDGGFDPTIGAVTDLWKIGQPEAAVPNQEELDAALEVVDYRLVELNEEDQTVYLPKEGMMLDLGAIAKGYITDEAARILIEEGVNTAIVDLGGDIVVVGNSTRGDDEPWNVGIQNPYGERGEIIGLVPVSDDAIVTSGIYERVVEQDGEEYHHLIDPETGFPFDNNIAGLSVIADDALTADALSSVAFALGVEEGLAYFDTLEGAEVIFVTRDYEILASEGIRDAVQINDDDFKKID
ncbi:FAD:protein FMN transferase [Alkalibacterium sp. MB6]|uniref:FAD:protein FMN transferase n=1 Tax=Alkalibacterium sp. MB6 TaxID=2081965 RepID=UPI00137AA3A8|nr:FAD:protein FMN transferase [Alkalibacterium sp. MB6]